MMYTYILILTLFISQRGFNDINPAQSAVSIESVEFSTKESCLSAANAWLKQIKDAGTKELKAKALCVPKSN